MELITLLFIDEWLIWHLLAGVLFGLFKTRLATVLAVAFGWEFFENFVRVKTNIFVGELDPVFSLLDVVVIVICWLVTMNWKKILNTLNFLRNIVRW